jgi:hypothetical protein
LFTYSVFWDGISWYFLGILPTDTKGKLCWYILVSKNWQEPFFLSTKGGFGPLLEHSAPLLREKGFPAFFLCSQELQKAFPPNPTLQKIPTGYTSQLVPVPYQYRPESQYWDGKQH